MEFYFRQSIFTGNFSAKVYMRPGCKITTAFRMFQTYEACIQWAVYHVIEITKGHPDEMLSLVVKSLSGNCCPYGKDQITYTSWSDLVKDVWQTLTDVPMDPESENIEEDWFVFPAGTNREMIWHWFDEQYPDGVAALMGV